jgi:PAS domain S-box-containing protein
MKKVPIDIIHYREKGWLNVGRTRMVLFDTVQGFYTLRKVINTEVGGNAAYLIFQTGIKGGFSFLEPMIQSGRIQPGPKGFAEGLSVLIDGGFGNFQIKEMNWPQGWARIVCENTVEGWTHFEKGHRTEKPLCDYSRGIILGFMQVTHQYAGNGSTDLLDCVEISCLAAGDDRCEFVIGTQSQLENHGYKCSEPRQSIQEQLKEHVLEKTREIQAATLFNENIIHSITDGIMVLDTNLKIQTWNRKMETIFSLPAKRVLGRSIARVALPFTDPRLIDRIKDVIRSGVQHEIKGVHFKTPRRTRIVLNLKMIPLMDKQSHVSGIIVLHEDVTDMERNEIRYRNLFETAQDGICLTDMEGKVISANHKMLKVLETDWKNLEGHSLLPFLPPENRARLKESMEQTIREQEVEPYELEIISSCGKKTPVEISITAVGYGERIFGLHIISRDITKRKKIEQQMIQTSKLAAVGELASGVAHEINNPLASIAGYAEDLLDLFQEKQNLSDEDRNEFEEDLTTIIEQTHRCKKITQNLLDFARTGDFELIYTDINQLLEKTLLLFEPEAKFGKVQIIRNFAAGLPMVETDPSQLQQVFLNLLNNAIDAVNAGGKISVTSNYDNGLTHIRFTDDGVGIPEKNLKKIFDPFFTTKSPGSGTGLGLSICYRIMEKLKGKLLVQSKEKLGTTFTVIIPERSAREKKMGEFADV